METVKSTTLNIPINRSTCVLFYLSKSLNIDISYLYQFYKKYKEDTFYIFFMLSGKKISIPKSDRLLKLFTNADDIYTKLTRNPDKVITKQKDLEIYKAMLDQIDDDSFTFEI